MFSGTRIEESLKKGDVGFTGTVRGNALLVCLGTNLLEFSASPVIVEPWDKVSVSQAYSTQCDRWDRYELGPKRAVLISAKEHLRLPRNIGGAIGTLSHAARLGLFAHFSSPFVEPGYEGYLALELLNASSNTICLRPGLPVAKILLFNICGEDLEHGPRSIPLWYNAASGTSIDLRSRLADEFWPDGHQQSS